MWRPRFCCSSRMTGAITASPEQFPAVLAANFNARDLAALVDGYTADAVMDMGGGQRFAGHDNLRLALENFLAPGPPITTRYASHVEAGDTALVLFSWAIKGTASDGSAVDMGGNAIDTLRRDASGRWRQLIDLPFGAQATN